jgi:hypothetical protein
MTSSLQDSEDNEDDEGYKWGEGYDVGRDMGGREMK